MKLMNELLLLIAMLFGLASLSGPTMANAAANGQFWTVADQHVCLERHDFGKSAPAYKPCAKKIYGKAEACQQTGTIITRIDEIAHCHYPTRFSLLDKGAVGRADRGRAIAEAPGRPVPHRPPT
jgi:hypothetical protein